MKKTKKKLKKKVLFGKARPYASMDFTITIPLKRVDQPLTAIRKDIKKFMFRKCPNSLLRINEMTIEFLAEVKVK